MDPVDKSLAPWRALEAQREALPLETQAIFILLCVESMIAMRPARDLAGQEYLRAIWDAFDEDRSRLPTLAHALEERVNIDDRDELAALLYAVGALRGFHADAAWGMRRLLDAAYERIPRAVDAAFFPSLADDTAHEVVRDELRWQRSVLESLGTEDVAPRIAHLRQRARARREASHHGDTSS